MPSKQQRQALLGLLKSLAYVSGPVTLASGKVSDFYLDCRQVTLHAQGASLIGELVYAEIARWRDQGVTVDGVGGLSLGADPIAVATAIESHRHGTPVHAYIVRKEPKAHGTRQFVEGTKNLPAGAHVVVVEDVVTTGGSTLTAVERLREAGYHPVGIVSLVDRLEGGGDALTQTGLPYIPLFKRTDFQ